MFNAARDWVRQVDGQRLVPVAPPSWVFSGAGSGTSWISCLPCCLQAPTPDKQEKMDEQMIVYSWRKWRHVIHVHILLLSGWEHDRTRQMSSKLVQFLLRYQCRFIHRFSGLAQTEGNVPPATLQKKYSFKWHLPYASCLMKTDALICIGSHDNTPGQLEWEEERVGKVEGKIKGSDQHCSNLIAI